MGLYSSEPAELMKAPDGKRCNQREENVVMGVCDKAHGCQRKESRRCLAQVRYYQVIAQARQKDLPIRNARTGGDSPAQR
jgi:hypothetical protein